MQPLEKNSKSAYSNLSISDMFQDLQWMPEIIDRTKPLYTVWVFFSK